MDPDHINYGEETILVVDDEESVRGPLVEMLRHIGFRCESVSSGKEALNELKENTYTFLLTDIRMPEMSGLELIGRIKKEHPDVCTIAMTGYSKEYKYIDVINAGATDFINKPFGIEELEAKVRRAIIERNIRQELSKLSITDALTGLYNQRYFYQRLKDEIRRAQRQNRRLSLILLDLDDFKQYNDKRGHLAGDELLQKVGNIISGNIRQGVDSGYRYGGDEFAVILSDADGGVTELIAKRIERAIEQECRLSASTGYMNFTNGMLTEEFVTATDQRLYKSKEQKKRKRNAG